MKLFQIKRDALLKPLQAVSGTVNEGFLVYAATFAGAAFFLACAAFACMDA
jgi:hypothetical protein